jgi:acetyl-CoA C-acetyltransferase
LVYDPSTPAIVGAAQIVQRPGDWTTPAEARGPIELMVDAARKASEDAGSAKLLKQVNWIGVVGGYWRHQNPAQLVAELIGAPDAGTGLSLISGSAPQELVGLAAERISAGELDVALIVGGESRWSYKRLQRLGERPSWISAPGDGAPEKIGGFADEMLNEARTLGVAATAYALFDDSLRISRGDSVDVHRDGIARLWSGFSAAAADNPHAWDRTAKSAAEIREPTAENRMIAFPYTKALVANNTVDMAAAILLCSVEAAAAAGIPADRLVFPHVCTTSHETWEVAARDVLHETPALAAAGTAALREAGISPDDVEHVDLYACFPAIVAMSAEALGLGTERPLTVTGGLGFAGAAIANSSGHAIAAMVPRLRDGGWGLVHANGGSATKHAFGVYSARPPRHFRRLDCQGLADLRPRPTATAEWSGRGKVEAATVIFDRTGPSHLVAAVLTPSGARALVRSDDTDLILQAMSEGLGGITTPLPRSRRLEVHDG